MIPTAVNDTKPYDREYLAQAPGAERVSWRFHEFRLSAETASVKFMCLGSAFWMALVSLLTPAPSRATIEKFFPSSKSPLLPAP